MLGRFPLADGSVPVVRAPLSIQLQPLGLCHLLLALSGQGRERRRPQGLAVPGAAAPSISPSVCNGLRGELFLPGY